MTNYVLGPNGDDAMNATGVYRYDAQDDSNEFIATAVSYEIATQIRDMLNGTSTHESQITELNDTIEALHNKTEGLANCSCSYDRKEDVCLHHSPQLLKAVTEITELKEHLAKAEGRNKVLKESLSGMVMRFYYDNGNLPELINARAALSDTAGSEGQGG